MWISKDFSVVKLFESKSGLDVCPAKVTPIELLYTCRTKEFIGEIRYFAAHHLYMQQRIVTRIGYLNINKHIRNTISSEMATRNILLLWEKMENHGTSNNC